MHASTTAPPEAVVGGEAVKDEIVGATPVTVIVAWAVILPVALVAHRKVAKSCVYCRSAAVYACQLQRIFNRGARLMLTEVELSTAQTNVALWPAVILIGAAENCTMRGNVPAVTVTATLQLAATDPLAPEAVIVYVVDCVGVTTTVPPVGSVPTPGEIDTEVAFWLW